MERRHSWRPASVRAHKDSLPLVLGLDVSGCDTSRGRLPVRRPSMFKQMSKIRISCRQPVFIALEHVRRLSSARYRNLKGLLETSFLIVTQQRFFPFTRDLTFVSFTHHYISDPLWIVSPTSAPEPVAILFTVPTLIGKKISQPEVSYSSI
jgi:hypothetical protein